MRLTIPDIQLDDRGVSPVIGVILMVAITVILAAVIGAFVLNLGNQVGNVAPQASIAVEDAGHDFTDTDNETGFYINHQTGDDIKMNNLRIVIQNENGAKVASLSSSTNWDDGDFALQNTSPSSPFVAGDQLTVTVDSGATEDETYTFIFIDTASGQTITRSEATLQ